MASGKKSSRTRTRARTRSLVAYHSYIYRILRDVSPKTDNGKIGMTKKAMNVLNSWINEMQENLCLAAAKITRHNGRKTVGTREMRGAVQQVFPQGLARHAISEATKATRRYQDSIEGRHNAGSGDEKTKTTRTKRAGLHMPVGKARKALETARTAKRTSGTADVFLAAVLEYIVGELLEVASEVTRNDKRSHIQPVDISKATERDEDIHQLLGRSCIERGGYRARLHPSLRSKYEQKKNAAAAATVAAK